VIFAALLRDELTAISEATQGIRALLERYDADLTLVEFDDPAVLRDLNTPADVKDAR
jgi:CTP:molybdopterin cytidylyltransferase MocA